MAFLSCLFLDFLARTRTRIATFLCCNFQIHLPPLSRFCNIAQLFEVFIIRLMSRLFCAHNPTRLLVRPKASAFCGLRTHKSIIHENNSSSGMSISLNGSPMRKRHHASVCPISGFRFAYFLNASTVMPRRFAIS